MEKKQYKEIDFDLLCYILNIVMAILAFICCAVLCFLADVEEATYYVMETINTLEINKS